MNGSWWTDGEREAWHHEAVFMKAIRSLALLACVAACVLGYVAGYLGATRLVAVAARRLTYVGMPAVFLGHIILVGGGRCSQISIKQFPRRFARVDPK